MWLRRHLQLAERRQGGGGVVLDVDHLADVVVIVGDIAGVRPGQPRAPPADIISGGDRSQRLHLGQLAAQRIIGVADRLARGGGGFQAAQVVVAVGGGRAAAGRRRARRQAVQGVVGEADRLGVPLAQLGDVARRVKRVTLVGAVRKEESINDSDPLTPCSPGTCVSAEARSGSAGAIGIGIASLDPYSGVTPVSGPRIPPTLTLLLRSFT